MISQSKNSRKKATNRTSCAQVHELPWDHWWIGNNWEGTMSVFLSYMHMDNQKDIYYLYFVIFQNTFDSFVRLNTYIHTYIHIYIYIYIYAYVYQAPRSIRASAPQSFLTMCPLNVPFLKIFDLK